jgi:hypothetical protein
LTIGVPGADFLHIEVVEHHCAQLFDEKIYLYGPKSSKMLGAKVMKKELIYLSLKRWGKVGRQELRSTSYKQEINSRGFKDKISSTKSYFERKF